MSDLLNLLFSGLILVAVAVSSGSNDQNSLKLSAISSKPELATILRVKDLEFEDEHFKACVYQNTGGMSPPEQVTRLNCSYKEISSAAGIEHFQNLEYLNLLGNQLGALDVSKNTALSHLFVSENKLKALDISKNTALKMLDANGNQLTSLDVSNNFQLSELSLDGNRLAVIDTSLNTKLTRLRVAHNQITSIDITNNSELTHLRVNDNQLTTLRLPTNHKIYNLDVSDNRLTTIRIIDFNRFHLLDVSNNPLTDGVLAHLEKIYSRRYKWVSPYLLRFHNL
jgi:Leucine-rich repeat (LRR) protein